MELPPSWFIAAAKESRVRVECFSRIITRVRPSSVFITDAGEVRIRGLAVDAPELRRHHLPDPPEQRRLLDVVGVAAAQLERHSRR